MLLGQRSSMVFWVCFYEISYNSVVVASHRENPKLKIYTTQQWLAGGDFLKTSISSE